ncbi:MAG: hypothetical protein V4489_01140 [Chlamydiota bacterium]
MSKIQKYYAVFTLAVIHGLKNYKSLAGLGIFLVTCLVIFSQLWKVVAAKMGASDLSADGLLWYIAFNEWVFISVPDVQEELESDLRTGRLAYLLPRPISYLGTIFCEAMGTLCTNLIFLGLVAFIFTGIFSESFPCSMGVFLFLLGIGFLAGTVGVIFHMLIGLSAFWLQDVSPFYWIWEKMLFALGGLMLPLAVYPMWLQKIAYYTPFPSILGDRSALIMNFTVEGALQVVGLLLLWGLFGLASLIFVYRRGLRIVNMEGG